MQTRAQTAGSAQSCRAWLLWPDLPASGEFHPGMGVDVLHGSSQALATQTRRTTHARASRDALGKTRSWNLEGLTGLSMTWLSAHSHSGRDPTPEASHSQPSCFVWQSLPHTSATVPSRPAAKPSTLHQPRPLQARHAEHEPELAKRTEHLLQEHKRNHARRGWVVLPATAMKESAVKACSMENLAVLIVHVMLQGRLMGTPTTVGQSCTHS